MINVDALHQERSRIIKLAKQKPLNPDLLLRAISDFVLLQQEAMETLREIAQGNMRNQKEVISAIRDLIRSLDTTCQIVQQLSKEIQTEEGRIRLSEISLQLANMTVDMGIILEKVNCSNNGFWKFIVAGILLIIGITVSIIFGGLIKISEEKSSHNDQC